MGSVLFATPSTSVETCTNVIIYSIILPTLFGILKQEDKGIKRNVMCAIVRNDGYIISEIHSLALFYSIIHALNYVVTKSTQP